MCNAWNHSYSCRCGWGGKGHLGRGTKWDASNKVNSFTLKTYRELLISFTNPNAHCPVCQASVFYYQSPFGGRVFFDALGPPWPKHPCTSQSLTFRAVKTIAVDFNQQTLLPTSVSTDGWMPFLCEIYESLSSDKTIKKVEGWLADERKSFFIRDMGFSEGAPIFIKNNADAWHISSLVDQNQVLVDKSTRAFVFESDLHDLMPPAPKRPRQFVSRSRSALNNSRGGKSKKRRG
jgi:hypothetical protein